MKLEERSGVFAPRRVHWLADRRRHLTDNIERAPYESECLRFVLLVNCAPSVPRCDEAVVVVVVEPIGLIELQSADKEVRDAFH